MRELAIAGSILLAVCIISAAGLRGLRLYLEAQRRELVEDEPVAVRDTTIALDDVDPELEEERFRTLLREGPRAMDARYKEQWRAQRLADGLSAEDVQDYLNHREPIVRL